MLPLGIHVTTDNYIIVGVKEPGPYTPTDKSTRALLIFGMDGKQQQTVGGLNLKYRGMVRVMVFNATFNNISVIYHCACTKRGPEFPMSQRIGCSFEPRSWRGVLDTVLCDNVCL
jgi:hypothetical protein